MSSRIAACRHRLDRDRRTMDRARRWFCALIRPSIEAFEDDPARFRDLIHEAATRGRDRGLWAKTTYQGDIVHGILSRWAYMDGAERGYTWAWLNATQARRVALMRRSEFRYWLRARRVAS